MINIYKTEESYGIVDENYNPLLVFRGQGCGCCSDVIKITAETIEQAKQEAREWLEYLEKLEPIVYPPEEIWN